MAVFACELVLSYVVDRCKIVNGQNPQCLKLELFRVLTKLIYSLADDEFVDDTDVRCTVFIAAVKKDLFWHDYV